MSKAGILVESHCRHSGPHVLVGSTATGKKSVLLSSEAPCVPARNVRQFVEVLLNSGDQGTPSAVRNYFSTRLDGNELDPRRKTAIHLATADLFANVGNDLITAHRSPRIRRNSWPWNRILVEGLLSAASAPSFRSQHAATVWRGGVRGFQCNRSGRWRKRPDRQRTAPTYQRGEPLAPFIENLRPSSHQPGRSFATSEPAADHLANRFFRCRRRSTTAWSNW